MATRAIDFKFNGITTTIDNYDENKTNLGTLIKQYTGALPINQFAGPSKIGFARPVEASTSIPGIYPHIVRFSDTIDWCFLVDNATAAPTRRVILYEYDRETSIFNWKGFITLTYPTVTNHTVRGFRVSRELYTEGTVAVSGTTVTGSSTLWNTSRLSVGSRIGFGSTDPTQILTWYEITAIGSDTSITINASAGTISPSTEYVIEDIIIITSTTNATAANGGLFISKGIRYELFTSVGTVIPAATTVDRIRAVYWLADASTVLNTAACGSAIDDIISWTDKRVYVLDTATVRVYVYNIRAALTIASGKSTNAFLFKTGNQAVIGAISQANNGRIVTTEHGPGLGVTSLYFVTATRIYRAAISNITDSSVSWQSDVMVEMPPGGVNTYALTNSLSSIEFAGDIDKFIVLTSGAAGMRSYVTSYNTSSQPMEHIFLIDDKSMDSSLSDPDTPIFPRTLSLPFSIWSEQGVMYMSRIGTTNIQNQIYTIPIGAHNTYAIANNQMLITPKFDISNSNKLYNVSVRNIEKIGTDVYSIPTEAYKLYYRTSGISDNSGVWTLLDEIGDLTGVSGTEIQFGFTFKIIGNTCLPARICGICLSYEDDTNDSHYIPSVGNSSLTDRIFAYRQDISWGSDIPNMRIRLYNADSGVIIIDDNVTSSSYGVFQYSADSGASWGTWSSSADLVGNYIRYTATSLPDGVKVKSILTQT